MVCCLILHMHFWTKLFVGKVVCGSVSCLSVFMAVCVFQRNNSALVPANQSADDIHTEQACGNIDAETCESTL